MTRWLKNNRSFLVFLALFGLFRTAVADWNPVPSGSMRPTIIEGDVLLVNRLAYAVKLPLTDIELLRTSEPRRGDVATFSSPRDGTRLVKRIVAVAGDVVAMQEGVLSINGEAARLDSKEPVPDEPLADGIDTTALRLDERIGDTQRRIQWLPTQPSLRSFSAVTVPLDHVMVLGDNRDNSLDSRFYGFVARKLLIGRAHRVLVSGSVWPPMVRGERVGKVL